MTEQLKTLKDIAHTIILPVDDECPSSITREVKKEIREEAIKWINHLETKKPKEKNHQWNYCNEQQKWIKMFFNLENKDLK